MSITSSSPPSPSFRPAQQNDEAVDSAVWWSLNFNTPTYGRSGLEAAGVTSKSALAGASDDKRYYRPVNDNEVADLYSSAFWYNALNPTIHTTFFGYDEIIGPICVSVASRPKGDGKYPILIRTSARISLVKVHQSLVEGRASREIMSRFATSQHYRLLLYYAMRAYFSDIESYYAGYLSWIDYMRQSNSKCRKLALPVVAPGREVSSPSADPASPQSSSVPQPSLSTQSQAPGLDDSGESPNSATATSERFSAPNRNTIQIREFIDNLFEASSTGPLEKSQSGSHSDFGSATDNSFVHIKNDEVLPSSSASSKDTGRHGVLAREFDDAVLAYMAENMTEYADNNLKPFMRHIEPTMVHRHQRIDFVIVSNDIKKVVSESFPTYRKFITVLERVVPYRGSTKGALPVRGDLNGRSANSSQYSTQAQSVSPYVAKALEIPKAKKPREMLEVARNQFLAELVETERSYVRSLRALIQVYVEPLRAAAKARNDELITPYDSHVIFGNIERILDVNGRFLADLEAWWNSDSATRGSLATLCRNHFVNFGVYKRYINGYSHALKQYQDLQKRTLTFQAFLDRSKENEEMGKLRLEDLLVMPVQRIPRYTLLIGEILKYTPEDSPDHSEFVSAYALADEIGQLAENQAAESAIELYELHRSIEDCPDNLISDSRAFIGAIDCCEVSLTSKPPRIPITIFIFSDIIMITQRLTSGKSSDKGRQNRLHQVRQKVTTSDAAGSAQATVRKADSFFIMADGNTKYYRFVSWAELDRIRVLEKGNLQSSKSFFLHRPPPSPFASPESRWLYPRLGSHKPAHQRLKSLRNAGASSDATPSGDGMQGIDTRSIFYCEEDGDPYWHPQYLHEYELETASARKKLNELFDTAIHRMQHQPSYTRVGFPSDKGAPEPFETHRISMIDQEWSINIWDEESYQEHRMHSFDPSEGAATVVWDYRNKDQPAADIPPASPVVTDMHIPNLRESYPHLSCCVIDCGDDGYVIEIPTLTSITADNQQPPSPDYSVPQTVWVGKKDLSGLCVQVERSIFDFQRAWVNSPGHFRIQQSYNQSILACLFNLCPNPFMSTAAKPEPVAASTPRKFMTRARNLISKGKGRQDSDVFTASAVPLRASTTSNLVIYGKLSWGSMPLVLGKYKIKPCMPAARQKSGEFSGGTISRGSLQRTTNTIKSAPSTHRSASSLSSLREFTTPKSEPKLPIFPLSSPVNPGGSVSAQSSRRGSKASSHSKPDDNTSASMTSLHKKATSGTPPIISMSHPQLFPFAKSSKSQHLEAASKSVERGAMSATSKRVSMARSKSVQTQGFPDIILAGLTITSSIAGKNKKSAAGSRKKPALDGKDEGGARRGISMRNRTQKGSSSAARPPSPAHSADIESHGNAAAKHQNKRSILSSPSLSPRSRHSVAEVLGYDQSINQLESSPVLVEACSPESIMEERDDNRTRDLTIKRENWWGQPSLMDDIKGELNKSSDELEEMQPSDSVAVHPSFGSSAAGHDMANTPSLTLSLDLQLMLKSIEMDPELTALPASETTAAAPKKQLPSTDIEI